MLKAKPRFKKKPMRGNFEPIRKLKKTRRRNKIENNRRKKKFIPLQLIYKEAYYEKQNHIDQRQTGSLL